LPLSSRERVLGSFHLPEQGSLEIREFLVSSVESGRFLEVRFPGFSELIDLSSKTFSFGGERFELLAVLLLHDFETSREGSREGGLVTAAGGLGCFEEVSAPKKERKRIDSSERELLHHRERRKRKGETRRERLTSN